MKLLAACFLAIALVFRAAPLCASPVTADAVMTMSDCDDAAGHHGEKQNQNDDGAARACHACVSPPVASPVFNHPMPPTSVPNNTVITRFAGRMAEPPTPPPRFETWNNLSIF